MRYEAYHNISKRLAQVNFNFKNIILSVSNHLQLVKCGSLKFDNIFEIGKSFCTLKKTCCVVKSLRILKPYTVINFASLVKIQGWEYKETL
jgi:hypothetical protein